jgi:hypothetical protein
MRFDFIVNLLDVKKPLDSPAGETTRKYGRLPRRNRPQRLRAVGENKPFIAAVNRCATQKQEQNRVFQHSVKPPSVWHTYGAAEAAPLQNKINPRVFSLAC